MASREADREALSHCAEAETELRRARSAKREPPPGGSAELLEGFAGRKNVPVLFQDGVAHQKCEESSRSGLFFSAHQAHGEGD
jgi:hypothetical protein